MDDGVDLLDDDGFCNEKSMAESDEDRYGCRLGDEYEYAVITDVDEEGDETDNGHTEVQIS